MPLKRIRDLILWAKVSIESPYRSGDKPHPWRMLLVTLKGLEM
jgi:hypothetical protein